MENSNQRFKRRIPLDADEAGTLPKAKAKRCLFGAVNHDDLIKDLRKITDKLNAESQQKWNFDFASETPLKGRFEWTKMDVDEVPAAYRMPHLTARLSEGLNLKSVDETSGCETQRKTPFVAKATVVDKENVVSSSLSVSRNHRLSGKRKANSSRKSAQKDNSVYRTQSKIIDHFQQRKIKSEVRRKLDL